MFKELRNKLIFINLGITTMVLITTFAGIYISATSSASQRPLTMEDWAGNYSDNMENMMRASLEKEKQAAAADLLRMLVIAGIAIEVVVAVVSYLLAEEAVRPVREAYGAQKLFIANASHEIKTPLAAISANLEAADIHDNKWIKNIETETENLTKLNTELLTLARTDLATTSEERAVNMNELVAKVVESFEPRLEKIDFKKSITLGNDKVKTHPEDLEQILRILLDNAIKYCDKKIRLTVGAHELSISNDGAKIKGDELVHVFERFYQTDKSTEGVGLGLSIAKAVAGRNGWKLTVESDRVTKFSLSF
jgi:two-component system, OmpR family, sensor histidine kinase CiaH